MKLHDADYWVNRPLDSDKDWVDNAPNWVESYVQSVNHPHRQLIIDVIEKLKLKKVLEIGCNTGANLVRIKTKFPHLDLTGIDISQRCISRARECLPGGFFQVSDYHSMPFVDRYADLTLADAVLMYSSPDMIDQAMTELDRVTKKYLIIIDRWNRSVEGVQNGHVWARNYPLILKEMGYKVRKSKIRPNDWPNSVGWAKYGVLILAEK